MTAQGTSPDQMSDAVALQDRLDAMRDDKPQSFLRIALIRLRRDRLTILAMAVLGLIAMATLGADLINEFVLQADPYDTDLLSALQPPSAEHLLGTDPLGQDQLARILVGGRISLAIGFFGALFTLIIGISLGMTAAYFGGIVDDFIMWIINTLGSIPQLFLLLIVGSLFDLSAAWLTVLFALLGWPFITRLVRSNVFSMREREYITASRALGVSNIAIMFRHILPNVIPIVIIATMRAVGTLMLAEAALSFLGFGVQPPTATWGNMLTEAQQYIVRTDARHLIIAPGVMITVSVLCLYIIGDGLRDALDPRLK